MIGLGNEINILVNLTYCVISTSKNCVVTFSSAADQSVINFTYVDSPKNVCRLSIQLRRRK